MSVRVVRAAQREGHDPYRVRKERGVEGRGHGGSSQRFARLLGESQGDVGRSGKRMDRMVLEVNGEGQIHHAACSKRVN